MSEEKTEKIPRFRSIEEEAAFWDSHSLTEFESELAVVKDIKLARPLKHHLSVQLDARALDETQATELAELNRTLEQRVTLQVEELQHLSGLRRFLSPQVAELIGSSGGALESHRREVTVVFCDLRGFTAFSETAEPEEVMGVLRQYHQTIGEVIFRYEGTLERFTGDGIMVFFNDPVPCPDPALRATRMAIAMRDEVTGLITTWRKQGHDLGFGVGIASGYATLGQIGFEGRLDYAAIGTVTNTAARLCGEAADGQILVTQRVSAVVEAAVELEAVGELELKGLVRPIPAYNAVRDREP